mgnify:FL=1|jgi:hypothetical protein
MQIDVNEEIVDQIMKTELRESITGVKQDIKNLKKIRKREKYQDQDLADNQELLPHLEAVYNYFGGNLK